MRRRPARALATSALLSVVVSSCGGDGPAGPGAVDGTANVTATGAVNASGSGLAVFQSMSSGGVSLFQVAVTPTSQTAATIWQLQIVNYGARLGTGTYRLSPLSGASADPTANFYAGTGNSMRTFNAADGELVITSSSPSAVKGTFNFTATDVGGSGSVTVQGKFAAKCPPGTTCL